MIHDDPQVLDRDALAEQVLALSATPGAARAGTALLILPCCSDPDHAEEIGAVAQATGLSIERVAALHAGAGCRV